MYLRFVSAFAAGISKLFITILSRTPVRSRFTGDLFRDNEVLLYLDNGFLSIYPVLYAWIPILPSDSNVSDT